VFVKKKKGYRALRINRWDGYGQSRIIKRDWRGEQGGRQGLDEWVGWLKKIGKVHTKG